jgi:hypothetical protein
MIDLPDVIGMIETDREYDNNWGMFCVKMGVVFNVRTVTGMEIEKSSNIFELSCLQKTLCVHGIHRRGCRSDRQLRTPKSNCIAGRLPYM